MGGSHHGGMLMLKPSHLKPFFLGIALLALFAPKLSQAQPKFKYWTLCDTCANAPALLSGTGLYIDIVSATKKLLPTAYHYDVNSPLWSDDAKKTRWVLLSKSATGIDWSDTSDYFGYPDSTVFIEQLAIDTIPGTPSSRVLWETRILINQKEVLDEVKKTMTDHWYGFSYKWNSNQKDAQLVVADYSGKNDSIRIWPNGLAKASRMKKWVFPSSNMCDQCHRSDMGYSTPALHARSVLGFFTAQLNRPAPDSAGINQLEYLFSKGVLKGIKPANWNATTLPKWAPIEDATAPIETRARAYLAVQCSGCHGKRGNGVGAASMCDINFDFHNMPVLGKPMELRHRYASARGLDAVLPKYYPKTDLNNNPPGLDSLEIIPSIVVPGYPQKSLVIFRQEQKGDYGGDFNQMPPASTGSTFEVNVMAMDTLKKWITYITPKVATNLPNAIRAIFNHNFPGPDAYLQGRSLLISKAGSKMDVSMSSVSGRKVSLLRTNEGVYTVPMDAPKGLYLIKVGSTSLLRYLL
jgi:hypothetical protein